MIETCENWSEPIPSGGDPYVTLVPYWHALTVIVHPIRDDALTAADWHQARMILDMEPVPPVAATFVWNMRFRQTVAAVWHAVEEDQKRRTLRRKARR